MTQLNKTFVKVDKLDYYDYELVELIQYTEKDKDHLLFNIKDNMLFTVLNMEDMFVRLLLTNGKVVDESVNNFDIVKLHYLEYKKDPWNTSLEIVKENSTTKHILKLKTIKCIYYLYKNKESVEYAFSLKDNVEESRLEITIRVRYNVLVDHITLHSI